MKKRLADYAANDTKLMSIMNDYIQLQKRYFYKLDARVYKHNGAYQHSYTMYVDSYHDRSIEVELLEIFRSLADWYYKKLCYQIEYYWDEDNRLEYCDSNDYEFTESGEVYR
jgi:hypothetical protein